MKTLRTLLRDNQTIVVYVFIFIGAVAASMIGTSLITLLEGTQLPHWVVVR